MFGTIRKHQNWLWAIIIAVTVVSFVIFFSPDTQWTTGPSYGEDNFGSIQGEPIGREEILAAQQEIRLSYFFRSGGREWPGSDEATQRAVERETLSRVFLLRKLRELSISSSDQAVGSMMKDRIGDYPAEKFEADILGQQSLTWGDFERFIRHECGILQLINAAAIPARLVNPRDAEAYFRKENEQFALQIAVFWASNYLSQVQVTPVAVSNYFNTHAAAYRIPRRLTIRYVEFPASNHLTEAEQYVNTLTNLDAYLAEQYFQRGTNFFQGPDGKPLSEEQAKVKMKEEIRDSRALIGARREASTFGNALISLPDPNQIENFEKVAKEKGYTVQVTPPFDNLSGLDDARFPEEFRNKAMALTTNAPIAFSPIPGSNAVFVIAGHGELPSEMPTYDQVKDKVLEDFKEAQALEMARNAGRAFHTTLTNGLALKKSFLELATEAGVKTLIVPPFSPANADSLTNFSLSLNPRMLSSVASDLEIGGASSFIPHPQGGLIAYLSAKIPVSDEKVKAELPEFIGRLRAYRQNEAFNAWFRRQAEQAKLSMPQRGEPSVSQGGQDEP
jgi:peptidyl-prolyl cis-trans isomerase D